MLLIVYEQLGQFSANCNSCLLDSYFRRSHAQLTLSSVQRSIAIATVQDLEPYILHVLLKLE